MMIAQIMLAFIIVLLTQGVIYHVLALKGLTYSCTLLHYKLYEGESNELVEVIENKKLLPLLWLKAETRFSKSILFTKNDNTNVSLGEFHRSVLSMPPMRRITRTYRITCTKRGYYHLGAASVTTGDLLGFVNKTFTYSPEIGLHVCPIPIIWSKLNLPSRLFQGDVVVRRFFLPDPYMPAGIREYVSGDPQKLINWKASAKTGKLAVHKHDFTTDSKLMVFFNVDYTADSKDNASEIKENTLEYALRILASILNYSVTNGQQTALWTNATSQRNEKEVSVPLASGHAQKEKLFAAMAEIKFVRTRNFHMLLREKAIATRDADILLMTRYMTKEIQLEIDIFRKAGNKVEVFTIPDLTIEQNVGGGEYSA